MVDEKPLRSWLAPETLETGVVRLVAERPVALSVETLEPLFAAMVRLRLPLMRSMPLIAVAGAWLPELKASASCTVWLVDVLLLFLTSAALVAAPVITRRPVYDWLPFAVLADTPLAVTSRSL